MKKLFCAVLSLVLVLSMLTACAAKPKDFSWNGLTISLDTSFKTVEIDQESASFANYFKMYVIIITYETYDDLISFGYEANMTPAEYGQISIEANEFDSKVQTEDGITYYTYTADIDGTEFTYMATIHGLGNAFWMVQFSTETKKFEKAKPQFLEWAKTVSYATQTT